MLTKLPPELLHMVIAAVIKDDDTPKVYRHPAKVRKHQPVSGMNFGKTHTSAGLLLVNKHINGVYLEHAVKSFQFGFNCNLDNEGVWLLNPFLRQNLQRVTLCFDCEGDKIVGASRRTQVNLAEDRLDLLSRVLQSLKSWRTPRLEIHLVHVTVWLDDVDEAWMYEISSAFSTNSLSIHLHYGGTYFAQSVEMCKISSDHKHFHHLLTPVLFPERWMQRSWICRKASEDRERGLTVLDHVCSAECTSIVQVEEFDLFPGQTLEEQSGSETD